VVFYIIILDNVHCLEFSHIQYSGKTDVYEQWHFKKLKKRDNIKSLTVHADLEIKRYYTLLSILNWRGSRPNFNCTSSWP